MLRRDTDYNIFKGHLAGSPFTNTYLTLIVTKAYFIYHSALHVGDTFKIMLLGQLI